MKREPTTTAGIKTGNYEDGKTNDNGRKFLSRETRTKIKRTLLLCSQAVGI
jgi:hypothetical protein